MFTNVQTYASVSIYINAPVVHLWCLAEFLNTKVYTIIIITAVIIVLHFIITEAVISLANRNFAINI